MVKPLLYHLSSVLICICSITISYAQIGNDTIQSDSTVKMSVPVSVKDSVNFHNAYFDKEFEKMKLLNYPPELKPKRLAGVIAIEATLYAATMLGLNQLWYAKYAKSDFHFFDDSREWQQMDKIAHAMSASTISNICYYSYRWSGVKHTPAVLYAGAASLAYMTTIEILDGYSSGWGFSMADMTANIVGTSFFMTQQLLWKRQYLKMKMSYHPTMYAGLRPDLLGDNCVQRIFKDYNGMTFWLTMGSSVFVKKTSHFPRWIGLSFGYGADGMTGGFSNPDYDNDGKPLPHFDRNRQFYLSMDIDFSMVKTRSKVVRALLLVLNAIKIPFPTLEYNTKGQFKFHYLYF